MKREEGRGKREERRGKKREEGSGKSRRRNKEQNTNPLVPLSCDR
jgi:hypothetical protein